MKDTLIEKALGRMDCTIHYWVSPKTDGPWLIFLHGAGADHRMFLEQIPMLYDRFRLLLWDARGHGKSRPMGKSFSIKLLVEDLLSIMQVENIEKATLIGQSMGGNTAQEVVFMHPDRVDNLVLVDCTRNTQKLSLFNKLLLNSMPLILPLYPWKSLVEASARAGALKTEVQDYLKETFEVVGKRDFNKIFLETARCLHDEEGYTINKPILLVCGDSDKTGNIMKIVSSWASSEAYCEFQMIGNAGHCSNQDNPGEFNKLLDAFLTKHCLDQTGRS